MFLGATKNLYNWLCLLVGWSVYLLVTHLFDDPHVAPYWPTWPCFIIKGKNNMPQAVDVVVLVMDFIS